MPEFFTPEKFSPARLFITLVVIIFVTEAAVMLLLPLVLPHDHYPLAEGIIDAAILTLVAGAFLWRLFMRPLHLALMSKTAQATAIMDTASDGIISIDERGIIRSFNRAAENMFGYAAQEAIGANVSMLMPEPYLREHDAYLANYRRTGQAHVIGKAREVSALRKDGTAFPIELTVTDLKFGGQRSFTGIIRDITERKLSEAHIQNLAHYDSLTGLPNRTLFYDRLQQAMALAKRERHELALLYLDLDRFKAVNDALGHAAGDELLKATGARIRRRARESDTVARMGGDEFTVLLPKIASREDTARFAQEIIEALSARFQLHLMEQGAQHEVRIGCSIGIAVYPGDAQEVDGLIKAADTAMYEAKQTRNAFRFYQPYRYAAI
jgi:diguanylate cyclase (GGDEF)-like protein/PAS domain S-box-containing protein